MPSFDIVSEIDLQELDNAVNQVAKEVSTRFDFRGGKSSIDLDRKIPQIKILADDDMKLRSIHQILETKLAKRSIDLSCLDYGKEDDASGSGIRQIVNIRSGIDKESAKKITKIIKESKIKVQAQIQDEQVRVTGKSIDDLQEAIASVKNSNVGLPLQFINMRS